MSELCSWTSHIISFSCRHELWRYWCRAIPTFAILLDNFDDVGGDTGTHGDCWSVMNNLDWTCDKERNFQNTISLLFINEGRDVYSLYNKVYPLNCILLKLIVNYMIRRYCCCITLTSAVIERICWWRLSHHEHPVVYNYVLYSK